MHRLNILLCPALLLVSFHALAMDNQSNLETSTEPGQENTLRDTIYSYGSSALGSLSIGFGKKTREYYTSQPDYMDKLIDYSDDSLDSSPIDRPLFDETQKTHEHYCSIIDKGLAHESDYNIHGRPYNKRFTHIAKRAHELLQQPLCAQTGYKIYRLLDFNGWILPKYIFEPLQNRYEQIEKISDEKINLINLKTVFATNRAIELIKQTQGDRKAFTKILIDILLKRYADVLPPQLREQLLVIKNS